MYLMCLFVSKYTGNEPSNSALPAALFAPKVVYETSTSIRFYWGNEKYTKPIPWEKFKKAMSIINSK